MTKSPAGDNPYSMTVTVDLERRLIRSRMSGLWSVQASIDHLQQAYTIAEESGLRLLLVDHTNMAMPAGALDLFMRAEDIYAEVSRHFDKVALVYGAVTEEVAANYEFVEVAIRNRGVDGRVFSDDAAAAIDWLTGVT